MRDRNTNTDAILLCNYLKTCEEEMRKRNARIKRKKKSANQRYELSYDKMGAILINLELCSLVQLRKEKEKEEGEELLLSPDKRFSNGGHYS